MHLPVRHGMAGVFLRNGHALSIDRVAADGGVHRAGIGAEAAVDHGLVHTRKAPVGELRRERLMGEIVFCHDQKAARVAVDAVDDAGAHLSADAGERIAAMVQQGVDERPVRVAGRGMHNETARLVHHDEIRVLVNNVERDILRRGARRGGRIILGDEKHVPRVGELAFLDGFSLSVTCPAAMSRAAAERV